ncbi:hypothetical protein O9992_09300 [Vibrio lentus]|nr:hypothetical protein [Vibrio lentus]
MGARIEVDGFRSDTAKHVELEAWAESLKRALTKHLPREAKTNPDIAFTTLAFLDDWRSMGTQCGEIRLFLANGFDSIINFDRVTSPPRRANAHPIRC